MLMRYVVSIHIFEEISHCFACLSFSTESAHMTFLQYPTQVLNSLRLGVSITTKINMLIRKETSSKNVDIHAYYQNTLILSALNFIIGHLTRICVFPYICANVCMENSHIRVFVVKIRY